MKSPVDLVAKLARQWQQADTRDARLSEAESWPVRLPIGKPDAATLTRHTQKVREHLQRWRAVSIGHVRWEPTRFRSATDPVELPIQWELRNPMEWVAAIGDVNVEREFDRLEYLLSAVDPSFHRLLRRQRYLWREKTNAEVVQAAGVALALSPGCATGKPLRGLSLCGIDSKFFGRHRILLIGLLDVLFDGEVSGIGLEPFLDALDEADHWLVVAPLAPALLPFFQQRVRARELMTTPLAVSRVLIVENEQCIFQLPPLPDTVAILGAGLNLEWMRADWLRHKRVAYWGDMDTWGLTMLARARECQPHVRSVLMSRDVFDAFAPSTVAEPQPANTQPPIALSESEVEFYRYLLSLEKGRLEQEFLPRDLVSDAMHEWIRSS